MTCSPRVRSVLTTTCWTRAAPSPVNPNTATLPLTAGPSDPVFAREPALAAGVRWRRGRRWRRAFAGVSTLPCLAFVQLVSDGLAGAAAPESGTTQTANVDNWTTSSSDGRTKTPMIDRFPRGALRPRAPETGATREGLADRTRTRGIVATCGRRVVQDRTTTPDPLIGRTLDGRYEVLGRLGEGGVGVVYRGRQAQLGRFVAIKVLHQDAAASPEWRRRFEREARALSVLAHPNVVPVTDSGIDRGVPFW